MSFVCFLNYSFTFVLIRSSACNFATRLPLLAAGATSTSFSQSICLVPSFPWLPLLLCLSSNPISSSYTPRTDLMPMFWTVLSIRQQPEVRNKKWWTMSTCDMTHLYKQLFHNLSCPSGSDCTPWLTQTDLFLTQPNPLEWVWFPWPPAFT